MTTTTASFGARERVLHDFEKGQLGLSANLPSVASASGVGAKGARSSKRKLDFDSSTVETLTREAEEAALRQIEREQAESLRHKLPDFWLPSLTPTYTSSGLPSSLKDVKVQTTCRGGNPPHPISLKSLVPVGFTLLPTPSASQSSDSTPVESEKGKSKSEVDGVPICPACKSNLHNNRMMFLMKPCSHVVCKVYVDKLVRVTNQCIVCDHTLGDKDMILVSTPIRLCSIIFLEACSLPYET
ncbi:hypothetical protein EV424DRAFT_1337189 [Suillus variegatus]|nr:hypothetical protein EV424DRAFT_1337189 [Suillus variegatus]